MTLCGKVLAQAFAAQVTLLKVCQTKMLGCRFTILGGWHCGIRWGLAQSHFPILEVVPACLAVGLCSSSMSHQG